MITTYGASLKSGASAVGRDDVFLHQQLDAVGEPLQDALRPDAVRPDARLDARPHAALDPAGDAGDVEDEAEDDDRAEDQTMPTA